MTATLLFVIRMIIVVSLYVFLGWALLTLWRNLRSQGTIPRQATNTYIALDLTDGDRQIHKSFTAHEIFIGRHPANDLQLESDTVSSKHALLRYQQNQWWLEDLSSKNGTFINKIRVSSPVVITIGDKIRLGDKTIIITGTKPDAENTH